MAEYSATLLIGDRPLFQRAFQKQVAHWLPTMIFNVSRVSDSTAGEFAGERATLRPVQILCANPYSRLSNSDEGVADRFHRLASLV